MYRNPSGGMITAVNGVAIKITTQAARTLNSDPRNILITIGSTESIVSMSLAKRFTKLPLGVCSKKLSGDISTSYSTLTWSRREAFIPPMLIINEEMSTKTPRKLIKTSCKTNMHMVLIT